MTRAVVLLSGGLDSATVLALAKRDGFEPYAISFDYGQRHGIELACAERVAAAGGAVDHRVVRISHGFSGSALVGSCSVPKGRTAEGMDGPIPSTYVPARNTVFLALALSYAESLDACDIFIGVNRLDYSGYPDCRPEFIRQFERMANVATRLGTERRQSLRIHAPLMMKTKAEIVAIGAGLGVDFGLTSSCYDPTERVACGACDSCTLRLKGFAEAGMKDPVQYA